VGPKAGLDGSGKPRPHRDSIPGPSSPYQVAIPTELFRPLTGQGHVNSDLKKMMFFVSQKYSKDFSIFAMWYIFFSNSQCSFCPSYEMFFR